MNCSRCWITIGALMGGFAVSMGAFAAHGLDAYFTKKYAGHEPKMIAGLQVPVSYKHIQDVKTAATYQMYHALALIAVGLVAKIRPSRAVQAAGWLFSIGIVLFSGGLYLYAITGEKLWGIIPPPIGGTLFIIGWVSLAIAACPCGQAGQPGTDSGEKEEKQTQR